MEHKK